MNGAPLEQLRKDYGTYRTYCDCGRRVVMSYAKNSELMIRMYGNLNHEDIVKGVIYRMKDFDTVVEKTIRKKYPLTMDSIKTNITDIAGVRIITYYKDDVYHVRDEIVRSSGLKVLEEIDYIKNPKPNGYRSLHLVLEVPISIPSKEGTAVEGEKTDDDEETPAIKVPVEVQIRSMFEEVWGEGDHLINYKNDTPSKEAIAAFKDIGDLLDQLDDDLIRLRDNLPLKTKREPEEPST